MIGDALTTALTPDAVPLTHVPRPVVRVNGSEWGAALDASLAAVRVRQQVSAPAACELECDLLADVPGPRPGDQVSVAFGPDPSRPSRQHDTHATASGHG